MSALSQYNRSNAIPDQAICLATVFSKLGVPFDPAAVVGVRITDKDPRDPSYVEGTNLLQTIAQTGITKVGIGNYQYVTDVTTIQAVGEYFDVVEFQFEVGGESFFIYNKFTVTANGVPKLGYITPQDLYDEGLSEAKYPAAMLNRRIQYNTKAIEMFTGNWFEPRKMFLEIDGPGAWELQLDIPIVNVDEVTLLDREFPVTKVFTFTLEDLVIYNRHITQALLEPDDRHDPRIGNVYFPRGRQNIRIEGTFGYTDQFGQTPIEIIRALTLMVLRDKEPLASKKRKGSLVSGLAGPLLSETTDGHSYTLGGYSLSLGATAYYTGDPEIDQILLAHRRPMKLGKGLGANVSTSIDGGTEFDRFRTGFDFFFGRSL